MSGDFGVGAFGALGIASHRNTGLAKSSFGRPKTRSGQQLLDSRAMSPRYVLLAAGSVAVLGLCVYLFFAVRSAPAASMGDSRPHEPVHATEVAESPGAHEEATPRRNPPNVQRNVAARRGEGETTASTGGASEPG